MNTLYVIFQDFSREETNLIAVCTSHCEVGKILTELVNNDRSNIRVKEIKPDTLYEDAFRENNKEEE